MKKQSRARQLRLFKNEDRIPMKHLLAHGGSLGLNRRKTKRPLDTKKPVHVVLRSDKAKGRLSLLNHQPKIKQVIKIAAEKFNISVYEQAIVGNHIHLLIRGKTRKGLQDFFRTIAALIARLVTKAKRGKPFGRFWSSLLYSRLLTSWKKEFERVKAYIVQNTLEALGLVAYRPRLRKTDSWRVT